MTRLYDVARRSSRLDASRQSTRTPLPSLLRIQRRLVRETLRDSAHEVSPRAALRLGLFPAFKLQGRNQGRLSRTGYRTYFREVHGLSFGACEGTHKQGIGKRSTVRGLPLDSCGQDCSRRETTRLDHRRVSTGVYS